MDIFFYFSSLVLYHLVYLIVPVVPVSGYLLSKVDEIYLPVTRSDV